MNSTIYASLELDVMQANELVESVDVAFKYNFPALVVHPSLAGDAIRLRGRSQGKFKIITPIDWPKGESFGSHKFRGLSIDALEADGFEVFLTGGKAKQDTAKEASVISDFIGKFVERKAEVRYVLGSSIRTNENLEAILQGLVGIRTPACIRTDVQLKLQVNKANTDIHNATIKQIRQYLPCPIKVSGNIGGVRAVTGVEGAAKFGINLTQARAIIKEVNQQPDALKNILDDEEEVVDDTPSPV